MGLLCFLNLENLSVFVVHSVVRYTVTITQVQESVSEFNLESESGDF